MQNLWSQMMTEIEHIYVPCICISPSLVNVDSCKDMILMSQYTHKKNWTLRYWIIKPTNAHYTWFLNSEVYQRCLIWSEFFPYLSLFCPLNVLPTCLIMSAHPFGLLEGVALGGGTIGINEYVKCKSV